MSAVSAARVAPVDRFFQFSLLGLLTSGYLAVVGSGYLDPPTALLTAAILLYRVLMVAGWTHLRFPPRLIALATIFYFGFYPIDYFYISRSFVPTTVHLIFFVAAIKLLTAATNRDYLFLKIIAFMELLAACVVSSRINFFVFLALFLCFAVATSTSSEIRRAAQKESSIGRVPKRLYFRLATVAVFVSFAILAITGGLFFILPRTARAAFQHFAFNRYHLAGFANEVNLTRIGSIGALGTPVMRVKVDNPEELRLVQRWRGVALSQFDGLHWYNLKEAGQVLPPDSTGTVWLADNWKRQQSGNYVSYTVHLNEMDETGTLFFSGTPQFVRLDVGLIRFPGASYHLRSGSASGAYYQVYSRVDGFGMDDLPVADADTPAEHQDVYLQLPPVDQRIWALAREITREQHGASGKARALEQYLRTRYGYTLELPQKEVADPLANFLFVRKKGHCEYFASAMGVMLRTLGIPSRVVTGFAGGLYNPINGWQIIRASDAHSWVEGYLPDRGWITFDPTPPDSTQQPTSIWAKMTFWADAADVFWQDWVLNYNLERQLQLASRMEDSTRNVPTNWLDRLTRIAWRFPASAKGAAQRFGAVALIGAFLLALGLIFGGDLRKWWNTRRQVRRAQSGTAVPSDATLLYSRMLKLLRRKGIDKPAWLTPVEFARVLPEATVSLLVEDITTAYNDVRFGGRPDAARRMVLLLDRLETTLTAKPHRP